MCAHAACTHDGMHAACMVRHERRGEDGRARGCDRADRVDEWWLRRAVVRVQAGRGGYVSASLSHAGWGFLWESAANAAVLAGSCRTRQMRCAWPASALMPTAGGMGRAALSTVESSIIHMPSHRHARRHRRVHARTRIVCCMNDGGFGSARLQEVREDELPILLRVRAVLLPSGRAGLPPGGPISTRSGRARAGPISPALPHCCLVAKPARRVLSSAQRSPEAAP